MTAGRILVHTDFTDASAAAVRYGRVLAESLGASLQFLHVLEEPLRAGWTAEVSAAALPEVQEAMEMEAEQWLDGVLSESEQERFEASLDVETGDIAAEIVRYAEANAIDIIVMSATKTAGSDVADVSAAQEVLIRAHCSVFVVR